MQQSIYLPIYRSCQLINTKCDCLPPELSTDKMKILISSFMRINHWKINWAEKTLSWQRCRHHCTEKSGSLPQVQIFLAAQNADFCLTLAKKKMQSQCLRLPRKIVFLLKPCSIKWCYCALSVFRWINRRHYFRSNYPITFVSRSLITAGENALWKLATTWENCFFL